MEDEAYRRPFSRLVLVWLVLKCCLANGWRLLLEQYEKKTLLDWRLVHQPNRGHVSAI